MNASHPLLPSEEWREVFLRRFKNFRKNAVQPTLFAPLPASLGIMPRIRERDHWWAFLTGVPMSEWDAAKKPKPYQKPWRGQYHGYGADALPIPNAEGSSQILSYSLEDGRVFSTSNSEMWRVTTDGVELTSAMNATASLPTPSGTPAPPDRPEDTSDQNAPASIYPEPTPKHMQLLFHGDALHLLMYFTHWIILHLERGSAPSPHVLTDTHSRWIFALLSRVRDDVSADEMSTLRSLARACMSLIEERKRATSNVASSSQGKAVGLFPMNESGCWMIITLVIGIWGQRDLWQDAEAMLRRLPA
ncbi:uncharacterized protein B0H18DRAFT_11966 [Fomitopsis serialis]|uniref:uncharacterized protein n=1 Tax=Fomitopsis serialis TaxID=139415 RepID=UPI002008B03E|nr:uncharacterized protein B0H18DRAFT_11966 [Neoantrodia serialis]KAH9938355.1 hypothetical protein B0H18DRAFT_11966 [Neoantrodia serialis]